MHTQEAFRKVGKFHAVSQTSFLIMDDAVAWAWSHPQTTSFCKDSPFDIDIFSSEKTIFDLTVFVGSLLTINKNKQIKPVNLVHLTVTFHAKL